MAKEIKLPDLGNEIEEATVTNCRVKVGQRVKKGDILFEIEADKATFEMESPEEGFVKAILVQPDSTVAAGQTLLIIGEENEKIDNMVHSNSKTDIKKAPESRAVEKTIDINLKNTVQTRTGYKGGQKVPLNQLAKLTAEKMVQSKRQIPCFYLNIVADVTALVKYLENFNKSSEVQVSYTDFLIKAVSIALTKWPIMTGRLEGDDVILADVINIGFTVPTKSGVIAPVIKDVTGKNPVQIAQETANLVKRADEGKLTTEDIEGACITISSLGELGIDSFIPIVIPGQCSIIGVGKIADAFTVQNEKITTYKAMKMTIAVDHRIANGAQAAQFLSCVAKLLEEPEKLNIA